MSRLYSLFCLAFFLPGLVHAEVSYDQFLRAVQANGDGVNRTVAHRLTQSPEAESVLPAPTPKSVELNEPAAVPSLSAPETNSAVTSAVPSAASNTSEILSVPAGAAPAPSTAQPVPMPMPAAMAPVMMDPNLAPPATVDFNQVFAAEEFGPSQAANCGCQPGAPASVAMGQVAGSCRTGRCGGCAGSSSCCGGSAGGCAAMSYYTPNLPPASSLRGYFNASPCVANVWDGYACEAAAECAKFQYRLAGPQVQPAQCCTSTH